MNENMTVYENAVRAIEEYLSELCGVDTSEHIKQGEYRIVLNNWYGCCESIIVICLDHDTMRLTYKMYYNVKAATEAQKISLTDYFYRAVFCDRCKCIVEDNGAIYVKVEHSCILYGLIYENLKSFERICTERIISDGFAIRWFIEG